MPSRRAVFHAIRSLSGSWPDRPALMRVLTPSSRMIHRLGRSPALVTSGVFTSPIRDESPVNNALPSRSSKSLWKKLRSSQRSASMAAGRIQYWSDRLNPMERSSSSFPEGMPVAMSSVRRPSLVAGIPRDRHHAVTESLSGRGCPSTYMPTGTRLGSNTSPTSRMRPAFDEYANSSTGWFRHIRTRFISNSIGPRDYGGWIHCFPFPMVATWMSFVHVDVPGETDGRNRFGKPLYGFHRPVPAVCRMVSDVRLCSGCGLAGLLMLEAVKTCEKGQTRPMPGSSGTSAGSGGWTSWPGASMAMEPSVVFGS